MFKKTALVILTVLVAGASGMSAASAQQANPSSFAAATQGSSNDDGGAEPAAANRNCFKIMFGAAHVIRCEPNDDESGGDPNACFCHVQKVVDARGRVTSKIDCDRLVTIGVKQTRVNADDCGDIRRLPKVASR